MKNLSTYIVESLNAKYRRWFKDVLKSQQSLISDNKLQPIDVDEHKIAKPKHSFKFEDFAKDLTVKQILGDKQTGFVVINQMIKNPKKFLIDEDKELAPECYPYFYQQDKNTYFVGMTMFSKTQYVDGFIHLVGIETSLIVKESQPLLKAMLNDFINLASKEGEIKGLTAKPLHPKMKAIFTKLGFSSFKDNKDIMTYQI
jgi:hypothetical protein